MHTYAVYAFQRKKNNTPDMNPHHQLTWKCVKHRKAPFQEESSLIVGVYLGSVDVAYVRLLAARRAHASEQTRERERERERERARERESERARERECMNECEGVLPFLFADGRCRWVWSSRECSFCCAAALLVVHHSAGLPTPWRVPLPHGSAQVVHHKELAPDSDGSPMHMTLSACGPFGQPHCFVQSA